jgi:hypothetical protein
MSLLKKNKKGSNLYEYSCETLALFGKQHKNFSPFISY